LAAAGWPLSQAAGSQPPGQPAVPEIAGLLCCQPAFKAIASVKGFERYNYFLG